MLDQSQVCPCHSVTRSCIQMCFLECVRFWRAGVSQCTAQLSLVPWRQAVVGFVKIAYPFGEGIMCVNTICLR